MKIFRPYIWILLAASSFAVHAAAPNVALLGALSQQLQGPVRVAADAAGNLYVTDPTANRVVVFNAFGQQVESHEGFAGPLAIAIAGDGRIYLSESGNGSVSVFDDQWNLLYQLGDGANEFKLPSHLAVDPLAPDKVYVADSAANLVSVYTGPNRTAQFGGAGTGNGQFIFPAGVCVRANGEVFVLDQNANRVEVFTNSIYERQFSLNSGGGMMGSGPSGRSQALLVDNAGRVFVSETMQGVVNVFDAGTGAALGSIGGFGDGSGQLNMPLGMVLDGFNRLCVASANNARVVLFGVDSYLHLSAQPVAGLAATGDNLVFSVTAGGTNALNFQWQINGVNVAGATNGTLTVSNAAVGDSGNYSVIVGGASATLNGAVTPVTVVAAPKILTDPQVQTVMLGDSPVFYVGATGTALNYQWQFNGMNLDGATNSSLFLPGVQSTQGGQYAVQVSNRLGLVPSAVADLTVITPPMVMELIAIAKPADAPVQLTMNVAAGFVYTLEATTDFVTWQPVVDFTNAMGQFDFMHEDVTNYASRFYRLGWSLP